MAQPLLVPLVLQQLVMQMVVLLVLVLQGVVLQGLQVVVLQGLVLLVLLVFEQLVLLLQGELARATTEVWQVQALSRIQGIQLNSLTEAVHRTSCS